METINKEKLVKIGPGSEVRVCGGEHGGWLVVEGRDGGYPQKAAFSDYLQMLDYLKRSIEKTAKDD